MITKYSEYIKESNSTNQFFTTYEETKKWLDKMKIVNYKINPDLIVDVDDNVYIGMHNLTFFPVKFGKIYGDFSCFRNNLISLIGSPDYVELDFNCSDNNITTLQGSPKKVKGDFYTFRNPLISLEGLSIYNLKKYIHDVCYDQLNDKIKEDYFDKMLEENPEIINLIDFPISDKFKDKWEHLFNANKFDLI
jgi:hypothetical protein